MNEAADLALKAEKADSKAYLQLIDHVVTLLSTERLMAEDTEFYGGLLKIPSRGEAIVVGDIHGDLDSLIHVLNASGFVEKAQRGEDVSIIFLGDYGDRGLYSPEVYFVVLSLKKMFPRRVVLLRGNHEGPQDLLAHPHDLPFHLLRKFGDEANTVYERLTCLFEALHLAVLVDKRYVMLHGGVPSKAISIEDLAYAREKHPAESHLEEVLWSDPVDDVLGTDSSPRGAGRLFGEDVTNRFLSLLDVQVLIRGHEPADDGYKINHDGKMLTLFSRKGAPYYNRRGAYLQLDLSENIRDAWQIRRFLRWI